MKKTVLLITALSVMMAFGALKAETYIYPSEDPSFSITFPDNWTVEPAGKDLSASPKDESVFLLVSAFEEADNLDDAIDNLDSELSSILSEIEFNDPEIIELNGITFLTIDGSGMQEDVEVLISVAIFMPDEDNVFLLLYLGTEEAEKKHGDDLDSIVNSITAK